MVEVQYEEMIKHNTKGDCWMAIHGKVRRRLRVVYAPRGTRTVTDRVPGQVYDVTNFLDEHPGGAEVMMEVAGGFPAWLACAIPRSHTVERNRQHARQAVASRPTRSSRLLQSASGTPDNLL